jgi:hypothetical protein
VAVLLLSTEAVVSGQNVATSCSTSLITTFTHCYRAVAGGLDSRQVTAWFLYSILIKLADTTTQILALGNIILLF